MRKGIMATVWKLALGMEPGFDTRLFVELGRKLRGRSSIRVVCWCLRHDISPYIQTQTTDLVSECMSRNYQSAFHRKPRSAAPATINRQNVRYSTYSGKRICRSKIWCGTRCKFAKDQTGWQKELQKEQGIMLIE
jgi:hypothetical protein